MRNHIISPFAERNLRVSTVRANLSALKSTTDLFICNSLVKIVPVNRVHLDDKVILNFDNTHLKTRKTMLSEELKKELL